MNFPAERENAPREESLPALRSIVAAITAVAATYAYFLIFAQFGFLHALTATLGEGPARLRPILAVMGAAGIVGSVLMGRFFDPEWGRWQMTTGFVTAGVAAGLTGMARTPQAFIVCAALTGLGTSTITVGLAALLRRETGGRRLGLCLGLGTGLAYALCNLPPVFTAGPQGLAALGIAAAVMGLIAVQGFRQGAPVPGTHGADYEARGVIVWMGVLFALVWFDSAAFYVIQHTPALKAATWTGGPQLGLNAATHLGAAVLAGLALDHRRVVGVALLAAGLLLAGQAVIAAGRGAWGAPLYAAGVSAYSTVLVFYPARSGRAGLAAGVYAVAGWTGSALGIGLAENRQTVPGWWPVAMGVMVTGLLGGLAWVRRRSKN